jgi:hypothetical protein
MKKLEDVNKAIEQLAGRVVQVKILAKEVKGKLILNENLKDGVCKEVAPERVTIFDIQCEDIGDIEEKVAELYRILISIDETINTPPTACVPSKTREEI